MHVTESKEVERIIGLRACMDAGLELQSSKTFVGESADVDHRQLMVGREVIRELEV